MNTQLMNSLLLLPSQSFYCQHLDVKLLYTTLVQKPVPTFSSYVLHYCVALSSLACEQVIFTYQKIDSGESFKLFKAKARYLYLSDLAYIVRPLTFYLREAVAHVLVRFALYNLPLQDPARPPSDLLKNLRRLLSTQVRDCTVELAFEGQRLRAAYAPLKRVVRRVWSPKKSSCLKMSAITSKPILYPVVQRLHLCLYYFGSRRAARDPSLLTLSAPVQIELVFKRSKAFFR